MPTFTITNKVSGLELGTYQAPNAREALALLMADAGESGYGATDIGRERFEVLTGDVEYQTLTILEVSQHA